MENDLAIYIAEELKEMRPFFQWKILNDTKKQMVEVLCSFYLETDAEVQVQDILGKNNETGYIQFEEKICFYDPAVSHIQPKNYLEAVSFDNQLGIEKGRVHAHLKQLVLIMSQGERKLREFVDDITMGEFELQWSDKNLNQSISTLKQTDRYDDTKLLMNLDDNQSFIEQFTGDGDYDGVERI